MLKLLLKKNLYESFSSIFVDRKHGRKRSFAISAVLLVMYCLVIFFFVGTVSSMYIMQLGSLLHTENSFMYHLFFFTLTILMGVFGSIFSTYSALYKPSDNDMLLSMPIKSRDIVLSRIISCMAVSELYIFPAYFPSALNYILTNRNSPAAYISQILGFVLVSLICFTLSALMGYLIGLLTSRVKHKNAVSTITSLLIFAVIYPFMYKFNDISSYFIRNSDRFGEIIRTKVTPLFHLANGLDGNPVKLTIFLLIALLLCGIVCMIIARSFIRISSSQTSSSTSKKKEIKFTSAPQTRSLVKMELKRFFSTPPYILNSSLGSIMLLMLSVFSLFNGDYVMMLSSLFGSTDNTVLAVMFLLLFMMSINSVSSVSISIEGRALDSLMSIPLDTKTIFKSKVITHVIVSAVPGCIGAVMLSLLSGSGAVAAVLSSVFAVTVSVFFGILGLLFNLRFHNLDWKNITIALKQGLNVILPIVIGVVLSFGMFALCFVVRFINPIIMGLIQISIFALLDVILGVMLSKKELSV